MSKVVVKIEEADYVGKVVEAEMVADTKAGTVFSDGDSIIVVQGEQSVVITNG